MATKKITKTATLVVEFDFERSTKGAHRFAEVNIPQGQEQVIGTLYVRRTHMPTAPAGLTVTIEVA